ncbi:MAG: GH25 family lysozyme [Prevotellaceae bacterium]|nr:GH25 family lysozyme [Prevotellaceae bacterium]MDY3856243.1 GH25 family lysozyme [Bacteroidaceae bacterium]
MMSLSHAISSCCMRLTPLLLLPSLLLSSCGHRTLSWQGGSYTGEVKDGVPDGWGIYRDDSTCYRGNWSKGQRDGMGYLTKGDTTYQGSFRQGHYEGEGRLSIKGSLSGYEGQWAHGVRQGQGVYTDTLGRTWTGRWTADTLVSGTLCDSLGTYTGTFDRISMLPSGFAKYVSHDGLSMYEGYWTNGRHNGFGICSDNGRQLQCGWWKAGRFLGERMKYTSARVYGIDISRYQHRPERYTRIRRGRRRIRIKVGAPIAWKKLRIVHLGAANSHNVVGHTDFPISFCYIKSTQGTSLASSYYASDARGARSVGIRVGAYHFMSAASGAAQARWFLSKTHVAAGDLPPMLDVELTNKQIRSMGGYSALYSQMLSWLRIVGRATGKRPIIYISQNFVNRHWTNAPQELQAYRVWIARYGQYKPYVKLLYWQLSPWGKVRGINGYVDINVFNGSKEQYNRYIESNFTDLP